MDFRSQLSAFQNNSGGGGNRGGGGGNRSPHRGYGNHNNSSNSYGRGNDDRRGGPRRPRMNQNHYQGGPDRQRRRYHSPDRDGLGDLRYYGYKVPKGLPPNPTPEERARKTKHLALLVISIDDLPYEHIWKAWFQTLEKDDYYISVVCHAKFPKQVKSEWLRQRLLVRPPKLGRGNSFLDPELLTHTPSWGSVEITRAMVDLLQNGMKIGRDNEKDMRFSSSRYLVRRPLLPLDAMEEEPIPPVDQFLYVSETCLPVATAQEFMEKIQDTTVSWVNACHRTEDGTPKNKYEDDQFAGINRRIPGQYRWKADQWVLLCRKHASLILDMDRPHIPTKHQLWQSFRDINASDEMYFPTMLAVLGFLRLTAKGEDTQRRRSGSQVDDRSSRGRSNSQGDDRSSRGGSNSASSHNEQPKEAEPLVEVVLKKPVTYTDWSEGMRNPASFVQGLVDFARVSRLARDKGCLVARKFAPFVAVPGEQNPKVTGQITAEEWKEQVESLKKEDEAKRASEPTKVLPDAGEDKGNEMGDAKSNDGEQDGDDGEPEESFIAKGTAESGSEEGQEGDEDEEEEENQLE